jgi:hypothetical protein
MSVMADDSTETHAPPEQLTRAVVEIERHVAASGWDQPPVLFALVETEDLLRREPQLAAQIGLEAGAAAAGSLTPVEQEPLGDGALDDVLGRIMWPEDVLGCALVQEVLVLPPESEAGLPEEDPADYVAGHPDRRELRLAVGVLRDGSCSAALRVRPGKDDEEPEVLIGADLAPNLSSALLATLA